MDKKELKQKRDQLYQDYKLNLKNLALEYVREINPYKKGDIIEDHCNIIKIESVNYSYDLEYGLSVDVIYRGVELKKDLSPRVKQDGNRIYLCNVTKKHN
jgi:hypothetical protein